MGYALGAPARYPPFVDSQIMYAVTGTLTVADDQAFRASPQNERAFHVFEIRADVKVAPAGADIIFDVRVNGVSIFPTPTDRVKILAGQTSGSSAVLAASDIPRNALIQIDVKQIGSTTAGDNATVSLRGVELGG